MKRIIRENKRSRIFVYEDKEKSILTGRFSLVSLLHTSYLGIYGFPNLASPRLIDVVWALLVGVIAGFVGLMLSHIWPNVHRFLEGLISDLWLGLSLVV